MNNKFLSQILGSVLVMTAAPGLAQAFDELNDTLYLENKQVIHLYGASELSDGRRALISAVELPEDSILSIDINTINSALSDAKNSPERIRFPYMAPGQSEIKVNQAGFVCGVNIVDVMDEEIRSDSIMDRTDLCLSLSDLRVTGALASNGDDALRSFNEFMNDGNLSAMNSLSKYVDRLRTERIEYGLIEKAGVSPIISPIKGCAAGCLHATSEYGMRMHPVLKRKRLHKGIDLRAKTGTSVVSVFDGKVLATRTERNRKTKRISGYGHYVIVVHPENKLETLYAHLSEFKTKTGQAVRQGDLIALSGNTGIGTAPHLHFETHIQGKKGFAPANPRGFLGSLVSTLAWLANLFKIG
ncbi:M23 family metallopeptidase [Bdellovibrio sp. ArHS]|uniref:M23 family metallopeptidase n=1 Tax=Bdellovibrio sp. ArHS TaxID=1569284 RepID=UPI0025BDACD2|nr:M23 family metallopeptidase [Bdellovibrio sp. ArHS]